MSDNSKAVEPNPVVVAAHSGSNKVQLDYYEQQPLKLKLPPQKSADSFVQALESESEPKVYHFGCSLLTAIERGNPLCLLNDLGLVSTEEGGFLSFNFLKITW